MLRNMNIIKAKRVYELVNYPINYNMVGLK